MILFGHPTGNPNSHQAALAHDETGQLEAFVVPWFPSRAALAFLAALPPGRGMAQRLSRRRFEPLASAPMIQGRIGEVRRLLTRAAGRGDESLAYEANDWLMRTMARECRRPSVRAVHSYEDCSLWQFEEAKRRGKACIYDMPIGYYPWWQKKQAELAKRYADWLPPGGLECARLARPEQKLKEMELADLVLAPSSFVERTIREFHPEKKIARASYGVDLEFWKPVEKSRGARDEGRGLSSALDARRSTLEGPSPLRFVYAGQCSIRKGIPVLLEAWQKAGLKDAQLELVGMWQLAENRLHQLPAGVSHRPPCSRDALRDRYQAADVFVFPSFFEGFGLVLLEAMACGLPAIASDASAGLDVINPSCGQVIMAGDLDGLVDSLRWFAANRDLLPGMKAAARRAAELYTWQKYRNEVSGETKGFV